MKKILMGSLVLTVLAAAIITVQMSSCTKTTAQTTTIHDTVKVIVVDSVCPASSNSITGLWVGTYAVSDNSSVGQQYYSFIIKQDGTMITESDWANVQHLAPGTWTLKDSLLSCSFKCVYGLASNVGLVEKSTTIWNKRLGTLTGKWYNTPPLSDSGTITLRKVN